MRGNCLRSLYFALVLFAGSLLMMLPAIGRGQNKSNLDQIPKTVMDGLKARFPKAEIQQWSKEKEGDITVYDFEFKQQGQKFEADIKEDGTIHNWERAIPLKNLPDVVTKVVKEKYPKSKFKEIMEITAVKNGKEELEGYEIVLRTAEKKTVEVTLAPDGRILELDSGDVKKPG